MPRNKVISIERYRHRHRAGHGPAETPATRPRLSGHPLLRKALRLMLRTMRAASIGVAMAIATAVLGIVVMIFGCLLMILRYVLGTAVLASIAVMAFAYCGLDPGNPDRADLLLRYAGIGSAALVLFAGLELAIARMTGIGESQNGQY